jgi:multiple antibiotic resistance protein
MILFAQQSDGIAHKLILIAIGTLVASLVWLCFHLAPQIGQRLSQTSMNISSRVMGLILAAMAVEFIIDGIRTLLPGLA